MATDDSPQDQARRKLLRDMFYTPTHRRRRRDGEKEETLTDWYGEEFAEATIEASQAPGHMLGELLKPMVDAFQLDERAKMRDVMDHWAAIVGVDVAGHCEPRRLVGKTLHVEVHTSMMRFQLEGRRRELEARLHRHTGGMIDSIRLQAGGASAAGGSGRARKPGGSGWGKKA